MNAFRWLSRRAVPAVCRADTHPSDQPKSQRDFRGNCAALRHVGDRGRAPAFRKRAERQKHAPDLTSAVSTAGKRLLARWYEIHLAIARPVAPILSSFLSNERTKIRDTKAIRWAVIALVGILSGAWFGSRPNPQAIQRQKNCLSWGIKDPRVLSRCRESDELET